MADAIAPNVSGPAAAAPPAGTRARCAACRRCGSGLGAPACALTWPTTVRRAVLPACSPLPAGVAAPGCASPNAAPTLRLSRLRARALVHPRSITFHRSTRRSHARDARLRCFVHSAHLRVFVHHAVRRVLVFRGHGCVESTCLPHRRPVRGWQQRRGALLRRARQALRWRRHHAVLRPVKPGAAGALRSTEHRSVPEGLRVAFWGLTRLRRS